MWSMWVHRTADQVANGYYCGGAPLPRDRKMMRPVNMPLSYGLATNLTWNSKTVNTVNRIVTKRPKNLLLFEKIS